MFLLRMRIKSPLHVSFFKRFLFEWETWARSRYPLSPLFQVFILFLLNDYNNNILSIPLAFRLASFQFIFHIAKIIILRHVFYTSFPCLNICNSFLEEAQASQCNNTRDSFCHLFITAWCFHLRSCEDHGTQM